jgi:hypothetical protein
MRDVVDVDDPAEQFADTEGDGDRAGGAEIGLNSDRLELGAGLDGFGRHRFAVIGRDYVNADLPRLAHELANDGAVYHFEPSRAIGLSDGDLGDVVRRRVG